MRSIRTRDFLYIWNMQPDRWPAGDPEAWISVGNFGDVDGSWAKSFILENRTNPDIEPFYKLNFGKRPEEELYDLKNDPEQVTNLAGEPNQADTCRVLRARIKKWMEDTQDPRVDPAYDEWDHYRYYGRSIVDEEGHLLPKKKIPWKGRIQGKGKAE